MLAAPARVEEAARDGPQPPRRRRCVIAATGIRTDDTTGPPTTSATTRPGASAYITPSSATWSSTTRSWRSQPTAALRLAVFGVEPGTRSAEALDLLASWVATGDADAAQHAEYTRERERTAWRAPAC